MAEAAMARMSLDGHDDRQRSPPPSEPDPQAALQQFIEHLLSPSHADDEPRLLAIGYELEALVSIYPNGVRLSLSSRPPSMDLSYLNRAGPSSSGESSTTDLASALGGLVNGSRSNSANRRSSQSWRDALFDAEHFSPNERIRYEVSVPIWEEGEVLPGVTSEAMAKAGPTPMMRLLVSLPPSYPATSPPQLQIMGKYLGNFGIDSGLFGDITRTYISSTGVTFNSGDVCVFEGLNHARELAQQWYAEHLVEGAEGEKLREADRRRGRNGRAMEELREDIAPGSPSRVKFDDHVQEQSYNEHLSHAESSASGGGLRAMRPAMRATFSYTGHTGEEDPSPNGTSSAAASAIQHLSTPTRASNSEVPPTCHFRIFTSQPIVDRKSTFIGHAIRVTSEKDVPLVIHEILSDRKIAKAAHPAMYAYRIVKDVGGVAGRIIASDYEDDGETAAGSRLAHLLEMLEVENVLVVVSRWYGGIHLGPDRFKHINQAGRDALEVGGYLEEREREKDKAGGKGRRK